MIEFLKLINIRKIIDENFENLDQYFDVIEKIVLPSEGSEYSNYDAVAIVNNKQGEFIRDVLKDHTEINVAIIIV